LIVCGFEANPPIYPAVLVGDAAVTPHPNIGMGYTIGFRSF
jgi:2-polyprenyl-6-methoxyphenol hydroxylase-like FAD-dependent oxidoreductase